MLAPLPLLILAFPPLLCPCQALEDLSLVLKVKTCLVFFKGRAGSSGVFLFRTTPTVDFFIDPQLMPVRVPYNAQDL